ncbi:MAG: metallophosphoesterase [Oscillospiraceae bacterium]|nr:metallophosphoesterase [Oscillospiraceae bacterium]
MIYITGDTHGNFCRIKSFCMNHPTTTEDVMIILGDAGINYYGGAKDSKLKHKLSKLPLTLFCIHGNHEMRPHTIPSYEKREWNGGMVWYEKQYPNILFAIDGEIYNLGGRKCIAIGGAYSVDKEWRILRGYGWWDNEQPSEEIKKKVESVLSEKKVDIILSHTCPLKYEPVEVFLPFINQSMVDKTTEQWLDKIEETTEYAKWYCGHYHTTKKIDKLQFMFEDIEEMQT